MDGKMGVCPDWYAIGQTAKYWGVPVWEMVEQPHFWHEKALIAMEAEVQAQKIKSQRK